MIHMTLIKDLTVACALTSIPIILGISFLPKSARFLYLNNQPEQGWSILKNFSKRTGSNLPSHLNDKLNDDSSAKEGN